MTPFDTVATRMFNQGWKCSFVLMMIYWFKFSTFFSTVLTQESISKVEASSTQTCSTVSLKLFVLRAFGHSIKDLEQIICELLHTQCSTWWFGSSLRNGKICTMKMSLTLNERKISILSKSSQIDIKELSCLPLFSLSILNNIFSSHWSNEF